MVKIDKLLKSPNRTNWKVATLASRTPATTAAVAQEVRLGWTLILLRAAPDISHNTTVGLVQPINRALTPQQLHGDRLLLARKCLVHLYPSIKHKLVAKIELQAIARLRLIDGLSSTDDRMLQPYCWILSGRVFSLRIPKPLVIVGAAHPMIARR